MREPPNQTGRLFFCLRGGNVNPDHFADTQWDEAVAASQEPSEPDEARWTTEAVCEAYNPPIPRTPLRGAIGGRCD